MRSLTELWIFRETVNMPKPQKPVVSSLVSIFDSGDYDIGASNIKYIYGISKDRRSLLRKIWFENLLKTVRLWDAIFFTKCKTTFQPMCGLRSLLS
jgi:hypothetical protein